MEQHEILEMELDAIVKASFDNIVITDENGIVLRASPNSLSIYGAEPQSIIGTSVFDLEEESIFKPSVTVRVLQEQKEVQVMQHTLTGRIVMATGIPVFNQDGKIIRVISFSHDLTELEHLKEDYEKVRNAMEKYETEIKEMREKDIEAEDLVYKSKAIEGILQLLKRVAKSDASVVLLGESGVGKTAFAKVLHKWSKRENETFIEVNCGAIPQSLFESEMFGYEAGSFTGAHKKGKPGLIEIADKGTLFLDEIGELPLSMQAKLLKVLQEKEVTRVGGIKKRKIDFRLVASTNRNLEEMVKEGKFREDLFYRLNVISITIPPLRERKEDIIMLLHFYLEKFNKKYGVKKVYHPSTIEMLLTYNWPGNVRELQNTIERLVLTSESKMIIPNWLPQTIKQSHQEIMEPAYLVDIDKSNKTLKEAVEEVEIIWLKQAASKCKTTYEMAKLLGINQSTVVRKLKKYNINAKSH